MRTTLNLPDGLIAEAKARAASEGRTLTSLVVEGLRGVLNRTDGDDLTRVEPLPAFGTAGGQPLVDLSDRDALWVALDADGPR